MTGDAGAGRPRRLVLMAGTGTEVGKTWVGARLAEHLKGAGARVSARKPVQSFDPDDGPTDADVLAAATGEDPYDVCPPFRWYEKAVAPFMAAEMLGRPPFTLADIAGEISWPPAVDVGLVETAGGLRSPMTSDGGDAVDLAVHLRPDLLVIVADAGLGTINATRMSVSAAGPWPAAVFLNRYDPADDLHRANRAWLASHLPRSVPVIIDIPTLARHSAT